MADKHYYGGSYIDHDKKTGHWLAVSRCKEIMFRSKSNREVISFMDKLKDAGELPKLNTTPESL